MFDGRSGRISTLSDMVVELVADPRVLIEQLTDAGGRVIILDGVVDEASFHDRIAAAAGFPAYYGSNLDALWDCLTDQPAGTVLVWQDWPQLAVHHPAWWARLIVVLTEWSQQPGYRLVLPVAPTQQG